MSTIVAHRPFFATRRMGAVAMLTTGLATWRQRRVLSRLDAQARADLGLSMKQVMIESYRPFWNFPR